MGLTTAASVSWLRDAKGRPNVAANKRIQGSPAKTKKTERTRLMGAVEAREANKVAAHVSVQLQRVVHGLATTCGVH